MTKGRLIEKDEEIKEILDGNKAIAVLGLSPKPERDSNRVARYMKDAGYKIIPVRPGQKEVLGETAYPSLDDVKEPVEIVDVFRRSELIMPHAEEAHGEAGRVRRQDRPPIRLSEL